MALTLFTVAFAAPATHTLHPIRPSITRTPRRHSVGPPPHYQEHNTHSFTLLHDKPAIYLASELPKLHANLDACAQSHPQFRPPFSSSHRDRSERTRGGGEFVIEVGWVVVAGEDEERRGAHHGGGGWERGGGEGGAAAVQARGAGAPAVRGAARRRVAVGDGNQQAGGRDLRGGQLLQPLRLQVFGLHQRHHGCLLGGLHPAVILQVHHSLRLADFPLGSGVGVPATDVGVGGGRGGVPGAGGRPGGVVGGGVLLLRPLLRQRHPVRGTQRRRPALLHGALPHLRLQGLHQVRPPTLSFLSIIQASRGARQVVQTKHTVLAVAG